MVDKHGGKFKELHTVGIGRDEDEVIGLCRQGRDWISQHLGILELDFDAEERKAMEREYTQKVLDNVDAVLLNGAKLILDKIYDSIGFNAIKDEILRQLVGMHFHIGSQILTNEPFRILCERINRFIGHYASDGIHFRTIDVGGGLGIDYDDPDANPIADFAGYFDTLKKHLNPEPGQSVICEPGRSIVAQCGSLIAKVIYVKQGIDKKFVIIDAGMNDLIRPALYQAHHHIENLTAKSPVTEVYDVVGPICESSDIFATGLRLPLTRRGDYIAIRSAGAYGESMASTYNSRPLPAGLLLG